MSILLLAGSGGHLTQLSILVDRIPGSDSRVWATDRTPQSESLLEHENVTFIPHQPPRSIWGLLRNAWLLLRMMDSSITDVYSTGAGIALSGVIAAYVKRKRFTYIESATRVTTLSLTGKVIDVLPGVGRYVQHETLMRRRWSHAGSVFDGFAAFRSEDPTPSRPLRVFVTVGANQHAGFERLIRELHELIPRDWESYWQYGPSDVRGLDLDGSATLTAKEMVNQLELADVVVSHAGTGSILSALLAGKVPIVVPRTSAEGEHVDEHQMELASFAARNGLAVVSRVGGVTMSDLIEVSTMVARRTDKQDKLGLRVAPTR